MNKSTITYQERLDELILDLQSQSSKSKVFILVEGDSDVRLFRKLFHDQNCKIEWMPGGKPKVEEGVQTLVAKSPLVIGVVDADFMHLNAIPNESGNVFLTDYHDMEMTIVAADEVFSAIAYEYTNEPKERHSDLRNNILKSIERIGCLKWLNEIEELGLQIEHGFHGVSVTNFVIDFETYFARVLSKSANARVSDLATILQKIILLEESAPNLFQLCNGHDFLKAVAQYISRNSNRGISDENIASFCRGVYSGKHYQTTTLYQSTKKWADDNNCVIY